MPDAASAAQRATKTMTELKVSGHLMNLEQGLYCIVQNPSRATEAASGLPGVRLSLPPGAVGRPEAVSIATFRDDGWLAGGGDAALVRISGGPAQILVTIYQSPNADPSTAPRLQVVRLLEGGVGAPAGAAPGAAPAAAAQAVTGGEPADLLAHVQGQGDVGGYLGKWIGEPGGKQWIEGFAIAPASAIPAADIEYQAVLGRGWLSPWVEGGQFCGSRGMALPILGLRVRLRGASAETHEIEVSATFVDGGRVGPVGSGEACEAESLAAVEAFKVVIRPRGEAPAASEPLAAPVLARPASRPALKAAPKAAKAPVRPAPKAAGKPLAKAPLKAPFKGGPAHGAKAPAKAPVKSVRRPHPTGRSGR